MPYLLTSPTFLSGWDWHKANTHVETEMASKQANQSKEIKKCVFVLPTMLQDTEGMIAATGLVLEF